MAAAPSARLEHPHHPDRTPHIAGARSASPGRGRRGGAHETVAPPRPTAADWPIPDNARVDEWNLVKLPAIRVAATRHDSLVDVYNTMVDEYNEVAEVAYSRWWLIPVPMPGGRARGSRSLDPDR